MSSAHNFSRCLGIGSIAVAFLALAAPRSEAQCAHRVNGYDLGGDGWNGAKLGIEVNGVPALDFTLTSGSVATRRFNAKDGDVIKMTFTSGNADSEIRYEIIGGKGALVAADGFGPAAGPPAAFGDCSKASATIEEFAERLSGTWKMERRVVVDSAGNEKVADAERFQIFDVRKVYPTYAVGMMGGIESGTLHDFVEAPGFGTGEQFALGGVLDLRLELIQMPGSDGGMGIRMSSRGNFCGSFGAFSMCSCVADVDIGIGYYNSGGGCYEMQGMAFTPSGVPGLEDVWTRFGGFKSGAPGDFLIQESPRLTGSVLIDTHVKVKRGVLFQGEPVENLIENYENNGLLVAGQAQSLPLVLESESIEMFCHGDGGDVDGCADCACGNEAPFGSVGGCLNSSGTSALLIGRGLPSSTNDELEFIARGATPDVFALVIAGDTALPADPAHPCFGLTDGISTSFFDGLRCVGGQVVRSQARATDSDGTVGYTNEGWGGGGTNAGLLGSFGIPAGQTRYFQMVYRDLPNGGCMTGQATSNALRVTALP